MRFGGALGVVFVDERIDVAAVGFEVFAGEDNDLSGESVAERVERGALFAGLGFGPGGVLGVGPVDGGSVEWGY